MDTKQTQLFRRLIFIVWGVSAVTVSVSIAMHLIARGAIGLGYRAVY